MTKPTPGQAARAAFDRMTPRLEYDWDRVAQAAIDAAKASGELVERSDVAEYTLKYKRRNGYCTCGQQWQDPNCKAVNHD